MASPIYPNTPGRGECVDACAQAGQYVWAHNPAAWVGIVVCALALIAWLVDHAKLAEQGELEGENDADQR